MELGELWDSINEKWQSFLEWSEQQGLPLKTLADALEEKGVPSLPAFIGLVLAVIGVGAFVYFTAITPPTAIVIATVQGLDGNPFPGVNVYLASAEAEPVFSMRAQQTDPQGKTVFSDVPPGLVQLIAEAPAEYAGQPIPFTASTGENTQVLTLTRVVSDTLSLGVTVDGPASTVLLFDSNGIQVGEANGTDVSFDVSPNKTYSVRVVSVGYREEERTIPVSTRNDVVSVKLYAEGEDTLGRVRVGVLDTEGIGNPVENASIRITDEATGALLYADETSEDGAIEPVDLKLGAVVIVSGSADGFLSKASAPITVVDDTSVLVRLSKVTPENSKAVQIVVVDADNKAVSNPVVRLYADGSLLEEKTPSDGVTSFDYRAGKTIVTAWKAGFLPASAVADKGSHTIILREASSTNSGDASVEVSDKDGLPLIGASVSLFKSDGTPLGVRETTTGIDGIALFEGIPLISVFPRASLEGRTGSAVVQEVTETGVNYSIGLLPGKGKLAFSVTDHFTGKQLDSASVKAVASDGSTQTCITRKGTCSVELIEGPATITTTLAGFEQVEASGVTVSPNSDTRVPIELVSLSIARNVKLLFLGVFDLNGNKVNSLAPSTHYNAKYLVRDPGIAFVKALAHVSIGGDAAVTGYEGFGAKIVAGADYNLAEFVSTSNNSNSSYAVQPYAASKETPSEYKWANFELAKFSGSRELSVQFKTKSTATGRVELSHRSAFFLANETVRDPVDAAAGVAKHELLASLNPPSVIPIEFQGQCSGGLCVQSWLEGPSGKGNAIEPRVGEEFRVKFKATFDGTATFTATTTSKSLSLKGGSANGITGESRSVEGEQSVSLGVPATPNGVEGEIVVQASRLSKDAVIQLVAEGTEGARVQKSLAARIVGQQPALLVSVSPTKIDALKERRITFTVTDASTGVPIEDATVTLGSEFDVLHGQVIEGFSANEQGAVGKARASVDKGKYVVSVEPREGGVIDWKVQADGYRIKRGQIDVEVSEIVEVDPKSVSLPVDSKTLVSTPVSVRNLLGNDARVSISITRNTPTSLTSIDSDRISLSLKGGEAGQFNVRAKVSEFVLGIAETPTILREDVQGVLRIVARSGTSTDTVEIPFSVKTTFSQQSLTELWSLNRDSVDFDLSPPKYVSRSQQLVINNRAPHPLVINFQPTVPTVFVTPLSAVISPGGSQEFQVTSSAIREYLLEGCIFEDKQLVGDIFVYATFQGIKSSKKINANIDISSSDTCAPRDGVQLIAPTEIYFTLPETTLLKRNSDGTTAIQLPDGTRALFQGYARGNEAFVATGGQMIIPQTWLSSSFATTPGGQAFRAQLVFPFATKWGIHTKDQLPSYLTTARPVEYENARVTFPAGTQVTDASLPTAAGGIGFTPVTPVSPVNPNAYFAQLYPPGAQFYPYSPSQSYTLLQQNTYYPRDLKRVSLVPASLPIIIEGARGEDGGLKKVEFKGLPFDTVFEIPNVAFIDPDAKTVELRDCNRTVVKKNDFTILAFPGARRVSFQSRSVNLPRTIGSGGKVSVNVPSGTKVVMEFCPGISGDAQYYTACFEEPQVEFLFTKGTEVDKANYVANVGGNGCEKINLFTVRDEKKSVYENYFQIGTTQMRFPPKASLDKGDKTTFLSEGNTVTGAALASNPCVDFKPCENFDLSKNLDPNKPVFSKPGQILSSQPATLDVELSDAELRKTSTITIFNNGAAKIDSVGINSNEFAKQYSDLLETDKTGFTEVVPGTRQPRYALEGQLAEKRGYKFDLTMQVPSSLRDSYGCVAQDKEFSGKLSIGPVNPLLSNSLELQVNVKVKRIESSCPYKAAKEALKGLSDFKVSYDSQEPDENAPGQALKLSFKNTGHSRFVTLLNNIPGEAIKRVEVWPSEASKQLLYCTPYAFHGRSASIEAFSSYTEASPLALEESQGVVLNCTATEYAENGQLFEINYKEISRRETGAKPEVKSKKINVVVHKPEPALAGLYSGSPQGDIVRAKDLTGFGVCEKYYCSYDQAKGALDSFVTSLSDYVGTYVKKDKFQESVTDFCRSRNIGGTHQPVTRTIMLQYVNSRQKLGISQINELASKAFPTSKIDLSGVKEMSGCGIYAVTAKIRACPVGENENFESWKRNTVVEVSVNNLVPCSEYSTEKSALANAPILLADSKEIFYGRQVARWPQELSEPLEKFGKEGIGGVFGSIRIGLYKDDENEEDKKTTEALTKALYGQVFEPTSGIVQLGEFYNDFPGTGLLSKGCAYNAYGPSGFFASLFVGKLAFSAITTAGVGTLGYLADYVASGAGWCVGSTVLDATARLFSENPQFKTCDSACDCLEGAAYSILNPLPVPGAGATAQAAAQTARRTVKTALKEAFENEVKNRKNDLLKTAAWSAGLSSLNTVAEAFFGDEPPANLPYLAIPGRKAAAEAAGNVRVAITQEADRIARVEQLKGQNPGQLLAEMKQAQATGAVVAPVAPAAKAVIAEEEVLIRGFASNIGETETNVREIFRVVKERGTFIGTERGDKALRSFLSLPEFSTNAKVLTELQKWGRAVENPGWSRVFRLANWRSFTNLRATFQAMATKVNTRSLRLGATIGTLALFSAMDCDLRPVEAKFSQELLNHLMVFHYEDMNVGKEPTLRRYSVGRFSTETTDLCPSDSKVCLLALGDASLDRLGLKGFVLAAALSPQIVDKEKVLRSVFIPDEAPVTLKDVGVQAPAAAVEVKGIKQIGGGVV